MEKARPEAHDGAGAHVGLPGTEGGEDCELDPFAREGLSEEISEQHEGKTPKNQACVGKENSVYESKFSNGGVDGSERSRDEIPKRAGDQ